MTDGEEAKPPFERWVALAGPPAPLWKIGVGFVMGGVIWFGLSTAVPYAYYYGWLFFGDETSPEFMDEMFALATGATFTSTLVLLLATGSFWAAAFLVAKLLHRQPFWTLVSERGRIRWRSFGVGCLLTAAMLALQLLCSLLLPSQAEPVWNQPDLVRWALFAPAVAALVFIQAGGEELFFRGYVMQRLASRFSNPLVWGVLPSLLFGSLHFFNGVSMEHSVLYVISTALFGVTAAAVVWRAGDLSAAIGMHVSTNVISLLYAGTNEFFTASPLYLWPVEAQMESAPLYLISQTLLLVFVLSPLAPFPRRQLLARRKDTRAAP
jgi:uncharacterized protein